MMSAMIAADRTAALMLNAGLPDSALASQATGRGNAKTRMAANKI